MMIDALIHYFEKYTTLENTERDFLMENIPVKQVAKQHLLLSEGEISRAFFFIIKGGVRMFYTNGIVEKTAFFYFENSFVSSYESFTKQVPAKHSLETIEDSTIAFITHELAYKLVCCYPKFEFLARVMMEEELIVYQDIISSFVTLSAEERYVKLLESNQQLLSRIPQYQLATYLGVAPETLSRIRKRIVTKTVS